MSTYSPSLRIELIATGDQAGVWGTTTNTNLGTLVEAAIAGYTSVSVTSADQALTALDGLPDQSRNMVLALTTTTTAAFNVYAPPVEKLYVVYNASAYPATVYNSTVLGNTTAAGTGALIPPLRTVAIWSDGTNFAYQNTLGSGATGGGLDEIFVENGQNVTADYTIPGTKNAMSTGPITVDSGVTVTISSGSRWVVL